MLRPFRPLRYDPAAIGDLSEVVAPPYDVISDAHREALHERSPYNVVRLILNRAADRYTAAGDLLADWRRTGVLIRDPEPALGFYVEDFKLADGTPRQREGIIGVVRLEAFDKGQIRPHERTFARAKEDRLRVLRACHTNLSPIFGLFADKLSVLDPARHDAARRTPDMETTDESGVRHRLWLIRDPHVVESITNVLRPESIVIADGHHRYETALAYRDEQRAPGATDPEGPHNFILMYLTSMSHPGLVILPTHRVLWRLPDGLDGPGVVERLRQHFELRRFAPSAWPALRDGLREPPQHGRFGVALQGVLEGVNDLLAATLADPTVMQQYAADRAAAVRQLDVTILDAVILRGLLGIDCTVAAQEGWLTYTHDDASAIQAVEQGARAAFLMNPPRIEDVQAVCQAGETMPEKSTYFFPKLLTGLVFHPLEDEEVPSTRRAPQVSAAP
jgi:uncharacterized protein (DUF1015 family)